MPKPTRRLLGPGLALTALFLTACGASGGESGPLLSGEAVLKASEWKFAPSAYRLEAGKSVKLTLQNDGKTDHDVRLVGLAAGGKDVEVVAKAGQAASVEFTPAQAGVYDFQCTLPGHKESGMVGKVEVVAAGPGT